MKRTPFHPVRALSASAAALASALLLACGGPPPDVDVTEADSAGTEPAPPRSALAVIRPTDGHDVRGTVRFQALETGGVSVHAELEGLAPGEHGFHVHEYGDCTAADGSSAGPHFPLVPLEEDAEPDFITGNLGEIVAGEDGTGSVSRELPIAELTGPRALPGRAVVVHRRGNDPSAAPSGATGPRVGCGVVGVAGTG